MAPRWLQDGLLEGLGGVWGARWPQDGAKRVSRAKMCVRDCRLGAQDGTQFWTCLAPEWIRRGSKKHSDDMLCEDTNFEAKMGLPGPRWTVKIKQKCGRVVQNQGLHFDRKDGFGKESWHHFKWILEMKPRTGTPNRASAVADRDSIVTL